jgi:diadenosine tetraphosphate (Ap4A) HIT family hydrolase
LDGQAARDGRLGFFLCVGLEGSMCAQTTGNFAADAGGSGCRFCPEKIMKRVVAELGSVWAVQDRYPVSEGHHLIVPKRHTADWFEMSADEKRDADELIRVICNKLQAADSTITGFNIGINCGKSAGQTIFHAHIHLIPRRDGDTPDPTGGVRGVIPARMSYLQADGPPVDNRSHK